jgi:hypothetical protein
MDFGRIIQMIINQLLRRAVNGGVNAAIRQVSRRAGPKDPDGQNQDRAAQETAKRARQAAKLTRRL